MQPSTTPESLEQAATDRLLSLGAQMDSVQLGKFSRVFRAAMKKYPDRKQNEVGFNLDIARAFAGVPVIEEFFLKRADAIWEKKTGHKNWFWREDSANLASLATQTEDVLDVDAALRLGLSIERLYRELPPGVEIEITVHRGQIAVLQHTDGGEKWLGTPSPRALAEVLEGQCETLAKGGVAAKR